MSAWPPQAYNSAHETRDHAISQPHSAAIQAYSYMLLSADGLTLRVQALISIRSSPALSSHLHWLAVGKLGVLCTEIL